MSDEDERIDRNFYVSMPKKVLFSTADMVAEIKALKEDIARLRKQNELASAAAQASYDWFYGDSTTEQEQAMCDAWFIWRRSLISD